MRKFHPALRVGITIFAIVFGLGVICISLIVWEFFIPHRVATLRFGGHELRLKVIYNLDVAHDIVAVLHGPKSHHRSELIAFIGAGESFPGFTVHQETNNEVFWVTADTMPKVILYAL